MEKKYFKFIIDDAIVKSNMAIFYTIFVSLISYDNNRTDSEVKENCRLIDKLIDVLAEYPDIAELQDSRKKLIEYNKMYKK